MYTKKYIKINKLFGKYNNEIDLSNRSIIFIGENGVGKTTIMKILMNLMKENFNELIKYDFESIDLEIASINGKNLKETLYYKDLLPSNEELENVIEKSDFFYDDLYNTWEGYIDYFSDEEKNQICDELYSDENMSIDDKIECWSYFDYDVALEKANCIYDGISCLSYELIKDLVKKEELKNIVRKILKNEEFDDIYFNNYINGIEYEEKVGYEFEKSKNVDHTVWEFNDIKETLKNIICALKKYIDNMLNSDYKINLKNKNKLIKIIKIIFGDINEDITILDMTKLYTFRNNTLPSSLLMNKLIDWKSTVPFNYDFINDLELNIYEKLIEDWNYEYEEVKDLSKDISEINNSLIDINSIIKHYFYSKDFVKKVNRIAIEYYLNFKNEKNMNNEFSDLFDLTKIKDIFIKFVRPIMIKNSPFDTEWTSWVFQNFNCLKSQNKYINVLYNFCKKISNEIKENINPKMIILQELLSKYFMNKNVEVTPMGILIKSKDNNQNIPLNSLSSGEKKLLIIFMHCLFNEDVPILIDEPEISLSIIWQENLLPDLLKKTNIKQIIVATHSPAIISDSILDKYIVPLPNSVIYKEDVENG